MAPDRTDKLTSPDRDDADEPGIFEVYDEAAAAAAIARAEADIAAGRVVSHGIVAEWLKTWGTPESKPYPREWFK